METTQENGLNRELADEVATEILATAAALQVSAEKPSAKVFRTGVSFEEYVKSEEGISIYARLAIRHALNSKDPAIKVKKLLDNAASDRHFYPNVKSILQDFWERDYGTPAS
jgi:hypothetical protein